jgi:hypothetical protein
MAVVAGEAVDAIVSRPTDLSVGSVCSIHAEHTVHDMDRSGFGTDWTVLDLPVLPANCLDRVVVCFCWCDGTDNQCSSQIYTVWNYRREALEPVFSAGGDDAAAASAAELLLTQVCRTFPSAASSGCFLTIFQA